MNIYYNGTDITAFVQVRKCIVRDTCGGRCDSLEVELENAETWYRWGPREDDRIVVTRGGYNSGTMYLNAVLPEDGKFRIYATALPCGARRKEWRSFWGCSLEQIIRACAMASGMDFALHGVEGSREIPYIQQENESAPSFLNRLLRYEGAALKCVNGRYAAIGIPWAQSRSAYETITVRSNQRAAEYRRFGGGKSALTVRFPGGSATARDSSVAGNKTESRNLPAGNDIQAGRWARGLLLAENREQEILTISTEFHPGATAMVRVDVTGGTDADGAWLVQDVEHDLYNGATRTTLYRCLEGVQ